MKTTRPKRLLLALLAGAATLASVAASHAQTLTTSWTNTFDSSASTGSWCWWYDFYQHAYTNITYNALITNSWDSTMNSTLPPPPTGGAGSGSLHWLTLWAGVPVGSEGGQMLIYGTFGGGSQYDTSQTIDATKYDSLSFDLYADPTTALDANSNVCVLTVGFFKQNYSTYTITNITIATNNLGKWLRYVCPIDKSTAPATSGQLAAGPMFNINCYGGGNENAALFTNTVPTKLWIDNLYLKKSFVPTPPPKMLTITQPKPGLNCFSGPPSSDQYQRNSIKLVQTTGTSWLGQTNMTYSFTITNFPSGTTYPGYQAHIFLATGPGTYCGLDYSETNVVWLNVSENADGTAFLAFRYKVNEEQSNSNMFGAEYIGPASAGTLVGMGGPTPIGTWSMTFNNDTNVTITGPGGLYTNFNMRAAAVANFIEPINVVFGAQPNNPTNVGQEVILADATVTNAGTSTSIVYDNFMADQSLDLTKWSILTCEPDTVFLFPYDLGQKLVSWTQPDTGFGLQSSTNLGLRNAWTTWSGPDAAAPLSTVYGAGGKRFALMPSANLDPRQNYFRLLQQDYVKLQVLMPGETAAPGTPTGKTGSPTAQAVGAAFSVIVNAVDNNWSVITGANGTIHLTSTDTNATFDADTPLGSGTVLMGVTFGTNGTWTVTATDTNNPAIPPGTGSPTVAHP
jgi:hypothetical protein